MVAETREKAIDASEQVFVDYEMLPAAVETDQSDAMDACQIWSDAERNVCFDWEAGNKSDTDEAFSKAKQVVELDLVNNRVVPTSMETRGAIGSVESDGRLALHVSCQGVHIMRRILATQIFNVEENQILVTCDDVGGGFGMKIFCSQNTFACFLQLKNLEDQSSGSLSAAKHFSVTAMEGITSVISSLLSMIMQKYSA